MTDHRTTYEHLLRPLCAGRHTLKNRFVMAPMTRCRSTDDHVPTDMMAEYYASCAGFGLIISEPTMIQRGYSTFGYEPGLFSGVQVEAWRTVTDAVHKNGGIIFCLLSHGGRATVPANIESSRLAVMGPSREGIPQGCEWCPALLNRDWVEQPYPAEVNAMTAEEVGEAKGRFIRAAKNAMAAGFDGVVIDAANGYLQDQFLRDSSNKRTDEYGGHLQKRCRFLLETVDGVSSEIGSHNVAVRISPLSSLHGMSDTEPKVLARYLGGQLTRRKLAFVDVIRGDGEKNARLSADAWVRETYEGVLFSSGGFTVQEAEGSVAGGMVDAVCFGTLAIANPDLVARVVHGDAFNKPDESTFHTRGAQGYTDYKLLHYPSASAAHDEAQDTPHPLIVSRRPDKPLRPTSRTGGNINSGAAPHVAKPVDALLKPLLISQIACNNRMVMGPLPRQRADDNHVPTPVMEAYYKARAGMGCIISEPCEVQAGYHTFVNGPGISTTEQVKAWQKVTDAVHAAGSVIFCQLHHGGRAVLPCNLVGDNMNVIGPSHRGIRTASCPAAFAQDGRAQAFPQEVVAVRRTKLQWIVKVFATAARNAMAAGFDGVEVDAANGFLIDQFMRDGCNTPGERADQYGGSLENRCRLLIEVVDTISEAIGSAAVGVRISPLDRSRDMSDSNPKLLTQYVADAMQLRHIAYLAVCGEGNSTALRWIREVSSYQGTLLCDALTEDGSINATEAQAAKADSAQCGFCFTNEMVTNPDLLDRAVHGVPLRPWPRQDDSPEGATLYSHGTRGYSDYLTFRQEQQLQRERKEEKQRQQQMDSNITNEGRYQSNNNNNNNSELIAKNAHHNNNTKQHAVSGANIV